MAFGCLECRFYWFLLEITGFYGLGQGCCYRLLKQVCGLGHGWCYYGLGFRAWENGFVFCFTVLSVEGLKTGCEPFFFERVSVVVIAVWPSSLEVYVTGCILLLYFCLLSAHYAATSVLSIFLFHASHFLTVLLLFILSPFLPKAKTCKSQHSSSLLSL